MKDEVDATFSDKPRFKFMIPTFQKIALCSKFFCVLLAATAVFVLFLVVQFLFF